MTFHPMAQKCVTRLGRKENGSVCELGNQTYTGNGGFKSTKDFYKSLGYTSYLALDVNKRMDAEIFDLNNSVMTHFDCPAWAPFDLVTNNGTGEHIFNQAMVFRNCHDLCKIGGIMLHILPFSPWINHGFYNYNPILFRDLAVANDYDIVFRAIGDRWGDDFLIGNGALYQEKNPTELEKLVDGSLNDLFVIFALKKNHDEFKTPFQGKYKYHITDKELEEKYVQD